MNGDSASSLTTPPTCSTSATASSPVGSYPSSCTGAADPNYTISYVGGEVVVGTAALVVSASSDTMTYGGALPTITPSYSGFVNGDNASSLTTRRTCSTTATSSSPVGSYPSSCTGAVDPNYTISYVGGETTIGLAPLMVTASSAATTYGSAAPTITPSYSGFVNGDSAGSLTTAAHLLDDGHVVEPGGELPELVLGRSRPQLRHHVLRRHGRRQRGESHDHRIIAVGDIRKCRSGHHRELLGLRERRQRELPHHGAHLLDDGHFGKPCRQLPDVVLGRRRPQLRNQLPGRDRDGRTGNAGHHGLVGLNHLRWRGAHHHGLVLGLRER